MTHPVRIDEDLVAASATPLVLGILTDGESWGYVTLKQVDELSSGQLSRTDGMLHPRLHRPVRLEGAHRAFGLPWVSVDPRPEPSMGPLT
jgi:PadR family transcriptional regulator